MFTTIDKSNYLRGLLILAKMNNKLAEAEKIIIEDVAKRLGFSKDFYKEVLDNLLENQYISDQPVKFSEKKIAKLFIEEGINLFYSENDSSSDELLWLEKVTQVNNVENEFLVTILEKKKIIQ